MVTIENSQLAREPPILRLSPALRRQIYSHFHDALGCVPCTLHLHGGNDKAALGIPALLLSCRKIYDEVSELLYSTNFFDIKCAGAGCLQRIRNLSDGSLSLLTELKIVLNEASCHHESCIQCCDDARFRARGGFCRVVGCEGLHDQALRPSDYSANNLLGDWRLAAAYIWSRVDPRKLNMSLVCDFDPQDPRTFSAARLAVAPLINLSPLRGCHIRLCRTPHHELAQIARNAVLRASGIIDGEEPTFNLKDATADSGSRLMSLPRELRFRILEYTDLITPWKEIQWHQKHKQYLYGPTYCGDIQQGCATGGHHACQFRRCWTDFNSVARHLYDPRYRDPRPQVGCFCRIRHAAFSFNCRCWSPPTDLFLVCRVLCKDAQVVFFSGNRFLVYDYRSDWHRCGTGAYLPERFAVVDFLRYAVPVDCVGQIRSLYATMSTYSRNAWPWEGSRALSEWKDTVYFMKEKMNLEGLTLNLTLSDARRPIGQDLGGMTEAQIREFVQANFRILAPLIGLGEEGLKEFFISIFVHDQWSEWYSDRWSTGLPGCPMPIGLQVGRMLSNSAARLVMGSRYIEQAEGGTRWIHQDSVNDHDLWHQEP